MRRAVRERATSRCVYCLIPEALSFRTHHVDHSIALKHGGATDTDNLALTCSISNIRKGTDLSSIDPESHEIERLFNPRTDYWNDHFRLRGELIVPITAVGRTTASLLELNAELRIVERRINIAAGFIANSDEAGT